jgi:hypothetical protein
MLYILVSSLVFSLGGWVELKADLDGMDKGKLLTLPGLKLLPFCRPIRVQSLSRLWYIAKSTVL